MVQVTPERDGNQKDFARIKANIAKMLDQNAPEADLDAYIASEGVTPEELQGAPDPTNVSEQPWTPIPRQKADFAEVSPFADNDGAESYRIDQDGVVHLRYPDGRESSSLLKDFGPGAEAQYRALYGKEPPLQFDLTSNSPREAEEPTSFLQGLREGAAKVGYKVAGAAESAADAIGIKEPMQTLGQFLNPGQPAGVAEASGDFAESIEASPYRSSGAGKFFGETAALLPSLAIPGGPLVQGGVAGGVMSDAKTPMGVAGDVLTGGALSYGGDRALRGAAQVASPALPDNLRVLFQEGVRATPGQIARSTGSPTGRVIGKAEDIVARFPGVGSFVDNAQQAGVQDFARAPVNRALRAIGERLPRNVEPGYNAIDHAQRRFRAAYQDVLPRLSGQLDQSFQNRINAIQARARLPADSDGARALENATQELGNAFTGVGQNGVYNGRSLRDASERLGDLSSTWLRSDDPYVRMAGDVADQYRRQLHALARRQNPEHAIRLRNIDRGYASLVRAERAALAGDGGVPTPRQYQQAVRQSDQSARRRQFAAGNALDQDLSNAGVAVLANRAAHGGSADNNAIMGLIGAGAAATSGNPVFQVGGLAGLGAFGASAVTHNPALLRAIQATMGRQTYLSPGTASVLRLLSRGSPPVSISLPNAINANGN